MDKKFTIKCDYCDCTITNLEKVPDDWIMCRVRINKDEPKEELSLGIYVVSYMKGPTCCPYHREQLRLIFT